MDGWKERLKKETLDLIDKVNSHQDFMRTKEFYELDRVEKDLQYAQHQSMLTYLQILGKRCENNGIKLK